MSNPTLSLTCVHHWVIESPSKTKFMLISECKKCGTIKKVMNRGHIEDIEEARNSIAYGVRRPKVAHELS